MRRFEYSERRVATMKAIRAQRGERLRPEKGKSVATAAGHARNYPPPRKVAKEATAADLNQAKQDPATAEHRPAPAKR
jgi:hypothetical protein